jgi:multidrug efflux pump subunit AcrB
MALYGISYEQLLQTVQTALMSKPAGTFRASQEQVDIVVGNSSPARLDSLIRATFVSGSSKERIPLAPLISYRTTTDYALLSSGTTGAYVPLNPLTSRSLTPTEQEALIRDVLTDFPRLSAQFSGSYLRDQAYLRELWGVALIAVALLFFILAAQFESLLQPFIVLLTIVFGSAGALFCLTVTGQSLNLMTGIGFIVLIGLLDNDSILKIDTMNRSLTTHSLRGAVREGGLRRLHSQLMTYLTTVLGLMPLLWASGLGAELQRPLALTVIGGMTLGVIISWTFIPLMYYWLALMSTKKSRNKEESKGL